MTDAALLQFSYILKSGKIATMESLIEECFEMVIPWDLLHSSSADGEWKSLISVESKGSKLQVPLSATLNSKENWLNMTMQEIRRIKSWIFNFLKQMSLYLAPKENLKGLGCRISGRGSRMVIFYLFNK